MKRSLVLISVAATVLAAAGSATAQNRGLQGGMANPNTLSFFGEQRTVKQQALVNEMRRLRAEVKAAKARNGGLLPAADKAVFDGRLNQLKAEYRQAG